MKDIEELKYSLELKKALLKYGIIKEYSENTNVFFEDEYQNVCCFMMKGAVKTYINVDEEKIILYGIHSEKQKLTLLNPSIIYHENKEKYSCVATEDTVILKMDVSFIKLYIEKYNELDEIYMRSYEQSFDLMLKILKCKLKLDAKELLYTYLRERIGKGNELYIKRSIIVEDTGLSKATISKNLKLLEEENLIIRKPKKIKFL